MTKSIVLAQLKELDKELDLPLDDLQWPPVIVATLANEELGVA
jgi:hypothetical protein